MLGVSSNSLFAFSSIYAQFQLISSVSLTTGSYIYIDLPIEFDNLNNIPINAIIIYSSTIVSSSTVVRDRRIEISLSTTIPSNSAFQIQFPNLPTPKLPCTT